MKIFKKITDLKVLTNKTSNLGFVPTMGGIHNGHISLINSSKKRCSTTLVSIYINPKQFNNTKDFSKYPKNIKKDLTILKKLKVNFVYLPKTNDIYKEKRRYKIVLNKNQKILCAKFRKGHFEGVIDIMDRFIKLIKPKYIFMGKKDFQQLFLIKKYIKNKYKTEIYSCKTIRDKNLIALSTRNTQLSKNNIKIASFIAKKLKKLKKKITKNNKSNYHIMLAKKYLKKKYKIKIDYLEARNEHNLKVFTGNSKFLLFVAYYINKVRLIDNF